MSDAIADRLRVVEADWQELRRQNNQLIEMHNLIEPRIARMEAALRAVLLFHEGSIWDEERALEWGRLAGSREVTTRGLCDCVRAALGDEQEPKDPA